MERESAGIIELEKGGGVVMEGEKLDLTVTYRI